MTISVSGNLVPSSRSSIRLPKTFSGLPPEIRSALGCQIFQHYDWVLSHHDGLHVYLDYHHEPDHDQELVSAVDHENLDMLGWKWNSTHSRYEFS